MVDPALDVGDDVLATRALGGDDLAFERLVDRYQGRVYRLACRLTSESDAPDILQETFLSVYRHLADFRGDASIGTWIYRVATNASLMHRRARARRPTEPLDTFLPRFDQQGRHLGTPAQLQVAVDAERILDGKALAQQARDALERLPDTYRDAFVLRDLEDLSTADVARMLGVTPAAVRQRVHRARLLLRGYLTALVGEQR